MYNEGNNVQYAIVKGDVLDAATCLGKFYSEM